jgi:ABC-2 type transport system permease protein
VQFTIYGLISSAMVLVLERKSGAMQRLLTTTISRAGILTGHALAMLVVVLGQQAILMLFGQLAFHVPYLRQPLAIGLVAVTYGVWVVSLGMLLGAIAKTEEQVIMWSLLAMFLFTALGGAWFPLEYTGKAFATIGHLMPTAWAMDGFQNVLQRGLGLGAALLPAGMLLAYSAAFLALALWRFRFE